MRNRCRPGEAEASPVNRLPCDSMIRTGRPARRTRKWPGSRGSRATPPSSKFDIERCAGPVKIRRVGRADEDERSGVRRARPRAGPARRRRPPTHIARPKAPRRNSRGAARRAIPTATRAARAHPRTGPTAPGRPPRARARRNARPGPRPRRAAALRRRRPERPDATTGPPVEPISDRRGRTRTARPARRDDDASESARRASCDPARTGSNRSLVTRPRFISSPSAAAPATARSRPCRARSVAKLAPCRSRTSISFCSVRRELGRLADSPVGTSLEVAEERRRRADRRALCPTARQSQAPWPSTSSSQAGR